MCLDAVVQFQEVWHLVSFGNLELFCDLSSPTEFHFPTQLFASNRGNLLGFFRMVGGTR